MRPVLFLAPPDLNYLPDLVAEEPDRRALSVAARVLHPTAVLDFGQDGSIAKEQAERAANHDGTVFTMGTPCDAPGLDVLEEHLFARGVRFDRLTPKLPSTESERSDFVFDDVPGAAWQSELRNHLARYGTRTRLRFRSENGPSDRADFGARIGLGTPLLTRILIDATRIVAPERVPEVLVVIDLHELAIHPLLEMYAGNGLWDRNRELLANIVP